MKKLIVFLTSLAAAASAQAQKLVIKGSDTLGAKLVPTLAEEYKAAHPGVSFEIAAEGSTTGITAIIENTAQIGMSSRRAKTAACSWCKSVRRKAPPANILTGKCAWSAICSGRMSRRVKCAKWSK